MKSSDPAPAPTDVHASPQPRPRLSLKAAAGWALAAVVGVVILVTAEKNGPASPDNSNPAGVGKPPPVQPLWSNIDWLTLGQVLGAVLFAATIVACVWAWRRHPGHPVVQMTIASSTLFWWDAVNNWMIGLVYNPSLWHFPRDWPWLNISPIIMPLTSFVYAPYVMLPYFLAMPVLRLLQKRRGRDTFVWRHPLICIAALTFAIGAIWDMGQEILLVRVQFLTYTHAIAFGTIDLGEYRQFPLPMAELITIVMMPASVLLYRDEAGKSQAEKLAQRFRLYAQRPKLATFLVMAVTLNIAMICFSSTFWLARTTGAASTVACPWPYPSAKTWDPQGYYESQGAPGPFTAGVADSWQIGQPGGRPADIVAESERCNPDT